MSFKYTALLLAFVTAFMNTVRVI